MWFGRARRCSDGKVIPLHEIAEITVAGNVYYLRFHDGWGAVASLKE